LQKSKTKTPSPRFPTLWIYLALAVATLACYSQVGTHDFVNFDDRAYVPDNPHVRTGLSFANLRWAASSIEQSNWFPLTWLSYMLDCQIFGLDSGAHHWTNVILHIAATLLLFAVFKRMTASTWPSAFVAIAFGLHPLHVESVAWIAERKDILCALFSFAAIWAYLSYVERPTIASYLTVAAAFACALLSKPMAVTLPFVLLLLDWWPLKRAKTSRVSIEKLPLIALAAAVSIVTFIAQQRSGAVAGVPVSFPGRVENALLSYVVYIAQFLWPANLAVFYPYFEIPAWKWLSAAAVIAIISAIVITQRASRPYLLVGWLWFLGTLIPVIGLVQVGSQSHADRYTYIPSIGLAVMIGWGAAELVKNTKALAAGVLAAGLLWSIVTWNNVEHWKDSDTLFSHAIAVTQDNFVAYNNLGVLRRTQGRIDDAVANFAEAVRIQPESFDAQNNLGEALTSAGRPDEAIPHLTAAVHLSPASAKPYIDLGSAYMRAGRPEDAASQFQEALRCDAANTDAEYRLAAVLMTMGRRSEAMPHFERAIPALIDSATRNPNDPDAHYNLAEVYGLMGRNREAISEFSAAVRLRPDDPEARFNLGVALSQDRQLEAAAQQFASAAGLRPGYAAAHLMLARIHAALGHTQDAVAEYTEALRIAPGMPDARKELEALRHAR
jgi:tetratricopeptide (TPR) repeat protein